MGNTTELVRVFRVDGSGAVFGSAFSTSGADFAEAVSTPSADPDYEPGDVLDIDSSSDRQVRLSSTAYSKLVAGIYSTRPGMIAGATRPGSAARDIPLALVGIVPCKVTTEGGPIRRGDLLVTSSKPGHAMRGGDPSLLTGATLGKALQPLSSGDGVIQVLVTLH